MKHDEFKSWRPWFRERHDRKGREIDDLQRFAGIMGYGQELVPADYRIISA